MGPLVPSQPLERLMVLLVEQIIEMKDPSVEEGHAIPDKKIAGRFEVLHDQPFSPPTMMPSMR
jgi:hypothetical protein